MAKKKISIVSDTRPITELLPNQENPRFIRDEKFNKLKKSIQDFPEMLNLREIVVDENMVILGGNMRLKALEELGITEAPTKIIKGLTESQKREFIVKDNVGYGQWDWDILANDWDNDLLDEWGMDLPLHNQEIEHLEDDTNEISGLFSIKLDYSNNDYDKVKEGLSKIDQSPEQAVWKLLKLSE